MILEHKIAIIGGSTREQIVADTLKNKGFSVVTFATEKTDQNEPDIESCLYNANALILPVRSNREDLFLEGTSPLCPVKIEEGYLRLLSKDAVIYCGASSEKLRDIAKSSGHILKEIMEYDPVAIPNAKLTAEGTLFYLMEHSQFSLKDITISVFGYGRVGKAVAELLQLVGSNVVVFCRSEDDIRHGRDKGIDTRYYSGIEAVLPKSDYLINTVPSKVIDEKVLSCMNPQGLIIDLASIPGGVDLKAVEKLQMKSIMLPGIPGKYAPISAGKILAKYYCEELYPLLGGE